MFGGFRPRTVGGLLGSGLVLGLYIADGALRASGGGGLPVAALVVLLGPGAVAAWVARRRGRPGDAEKEGALAGVLTAHFAGALLMVALAVGVLNIDWAGYEAQVGPQIAGGVKETVVPAAVVAGVVSLMIVYAGCVAAGWLGALLSRLAGRK